MKEEKSFSPSSGYLMLFITILLILVPIPLIIISKMVILLVFLIIGIFFAIGFFIINPNESMVLILFGSYKGTVLTNGFFLGESFFCKEEDIFKSQEY